MTEAEAKAEAYRSFGSVDKARDGMREARMLSRKVPELVLRNVIACAGFFILARVLVQLGQRSGSGWFAADAGLTAAALIGVGVAWRLRARPAALLLAGFAAAFLSELAVHSYFGIRAAQGGPTHFAVLAGVLGVAFGALLSSGRNRDSSALPKSEDQPRAGIALRPAALALGLTLVVLAAGLV